MSTTGARRATASLGLVALLIGCAQSNGRGDDVDAGIAADTRHDRDVLGTHDTAMTPSEAFCVGLDPRSQACAREVVARIDADTCVDQHACSGTPPSHDECATYYPPEGSWLTAASQGQLVLVRLGVLRVDLDAASCMLRANSTCPTEVVTCGPLFVPTTERGGGDLCRLNEECGEQMYCALVQNDRVELCSAGICTPRLATHAACDPAAGAPCAWNEFCVEGRCQPLREHVYDAPEGARCGWVVDPTGLQDVRCDSDTFCPDARTPMPTCQRRALLGEPCRGGCAAGLICETETCVHEPPLPRVGDPCTRGGQGLCRPGTFGLMCDEGTCARSERRLGERCAQGWAPCMEGFCAYQEDASGVAADRCGASRLPNRAFCGAIDACESGVCCGGRCTEL